jgi:NAD(P)-dependent dehydrogenase (short-subunit alcohol dehydrogenase family)
VEPLGWALRWHKSLSALKTWDIHLIDRNPSAGAAAAASVPATFHLANVTSYSSLASVFKSIFQSTSRIDFVFADAGIAEKQNFYEKHLGTGIEPQSELSLLCMDICLGSVISTAYLALRYFRLSS